MSVHVCFGPNPRGSWEAFGDSKALLKCFWEAAGLLAADKAVLRLLWIVHGLFQASSELPSVAALFSLRPQAKAETTKES